MDRDEFKRSTKVRRVYEQVATYLFLAGITTLLLLVIWAGVEVGSLRVELKQCEAKSGKALATVEKLAGMLKDWNEESNR